MSPSIKGLPQLNVTVPDAGALNATTKIVGTIATVNAYGSDVTAEGLYAGKIDIRWAGNSSLISPKKSYNVTTLTAAGSNNDVPWLNLPAGRDWRLGAEAFDPTALKNYSAYKLGNQLSRLPWTPKAKMVELYINGVYEGTYTLTERVKVHPNRIRIIGAAAIEAEIVADSQADAGAYLFTTPVLHDLPVVGNPNIPSSFQLDLPKASSMTQGQKDALTALMVEVETKLFAHDFTGFFALVDIDSLVDFYLWEEFLKNLDSNRMGSWRIARDNPSGYLGGKFFFVGWDWDFSLELPHVTGSGFLDALFAPDTLLASQGAWMAQVVQSTVFMDKLKARFVGLLPLLHRHTAIFQTDSDFMASTGATARNFTKWGFLNPFGVTEYKHATPAEAVTGCVTWLKARIAWMRTQWEASAATTRKPITV